MSTASPTVPRATTENPAEDVMGGLLITIFVACVLYGMTTLQTFLYSQTYTKDGRFLKFLVYTVCLYPAITGYWRRYIRRSASSLSTACKSADR
ncbi:hypothetical protein K466DRAFT_582716 [Polyporus arcularius HHB13444]|uniref:Uncharacterized protein n=1 Tax=Polyporus arcularius HHB13444 TaxID=1314778 RepID=A0A5C3PPF4_9APHY|nr:hypothetical protein K466DRAFT_582716 [Polyporus arcularius HHB13444]